MACVSGKGIKATITVADKRDIFAESMSRAIIEVAPENAAAFETMLGDLKFQKIGSIGGDTFVINDVTMKLADMQSVYYNTFKQVIEGDL